MSRRRVYLGEQESVYDFENIESEIKKLKEANPLTDEDFRNQLIRGNVYDPNGFEIRVNGISYCYWIENGFKRPVKFANTNPDPCKFLCRIDVEP